MAASTSEGITQRVRDYLHDQIQRLSFTYHDNNQTGELIQRVTSDVDALRRFFADQAIESGRILMLFVVNFTAIFLISWQLALISVIVIPFVLVMSVFFFKKVSTRYEAYQEQEAVLSSTLEQNLSGVRVVKAFARQEYEEEKFQAVNQEKYRLGQRLLWMHSLYWPISDTLCGFQMVLGFAVGALMAINGTYHRRHLYGLLRHDHLADLADSQSGSPDHPDVDRPGLVQARLQGRRRGARGDRLQ